jgi:hypothetical protein
MSEQGTPPREWCEEKVGDYFVRVAIGVENDAYANFELFVEETEWSVEAGANATERERVAQGFVRFDGCVNATLVRDDGIMHHWCHRRQLTDFGAALGKARDMAADLMPGWCG